MGTVQAFDLRRRNESVVHCQGALCSGRVARSLLVYNEKARLGHDRQHRAVWPWLRLANVRRVRPSRKDSVNRHDAFREASSKTTLNTAQRIVSALQLIDNLVGDAKARHMPCPHKLGLIDFPPRDRGRTGTRLTQARFLEFL